MSNFNPNQQFDLLKDKVIEAYKNALNVKDKNVEVKVNNISIDDTKDSEDLKGQKKAIQNLEYQVISNWI